MALKAAKVGGPHDDDEGRLYREIGRSKPAPQGIAVVNSAGKALAWSLMFDGDASVVGFLDACLERYRANRAVATERWMSFPGRKLDDVADAGGSPVVPDGHPKGERCVATPGWPEGTLVGRMTGRALKDGKPVADVLQQEHYVEDRFDLSPEAQRALLAGEGLPAGAPGQSAKAGRFRLPEEVARTLVSHAFLGMLDVNPLGAPGGKSDRESIELWGRREGSVIRLEGTSDVAGGQAQAGRDTDGRLWTHEVKLAWRGVVEVKDGRVERLLAVAEGRAKLRWGNERMAGGSDVSRLPAGRPIDFDGEVRFGFEARPVRPEEVGPGERADGPPAGRSPDPTAGEGPPRAIREKMARLQKSLRERGGSERVGRLLERFEPLMREGRFREAEALLDEALKE